MQFLSAENNKGTFSSLKIENQYFPIKAALIVMGHNVSSLHRQQPMYLHWNDYDNCSIKSSQNSSWAVILGNPLGMQEVTPSKNPCNMFVAYEVSQSKPVLDDGTWNQYCKAPLTLISRLDHSTTQHLLSGFIKLNEGRTWPCNSIP